MISVEKARAKSRENESRTHSKHDIVKYKVLKDIEKQIRKASKDGKWYIFYNRSHYKNWQFVYLEMSDMKPFIDAGFVVNVGFDNSYFIISWEDKK